jgi:hypothetical protein
MWSGTDAEVNSGTGNVQLIKEDVRHVTVVMLAGMDYDFYNTCRVERTTDYRGLHELRPCTHYADNLHVRLGSREEAFSEDGS